VFAAAGCRGDPVCGPRGDHSVVACVDGQPVSAAEVTEVRGAAPAAALDQAVRIRLFASEAARRGLDAGGGPPARQRAVLYQALVRDEAAKQGATPEQVSEDEARAYYAAHPGEFNKITQTFVDAVMFDDEAAARAAQASGDAAFAGAVEIGEIHADGVDPALTRAGNDLRAEGAIGGPVQLGDGRWALVRALQVVFEPKPFDALMARTVENSIAHQRELAALDALAATLRAAHRVETFPDELSFVTAP
jgi:hypothetical protein